MVSGYCASRGGWMVLAMCQAFLLPLVCWLYGLPLRPVFYALILMGSVLLLFIALDFWRFAGRIRNLEAKKAQAAAKSLFVKGSDDANMPSTTLAEEDLTNDEIGVLTLLVKTKLAPSNAEARRLVQGGGVSIDDKKVDDPKQTISADTLRTGIVIKKGKKIFHKATLA